MLTTILNLISLEEPTAPAGGGMSWIFLVAIVVLFGWMFWKQSRDQKKRKEQIAKLDKGAKVVTNAGIYGKICEVNDATFIVEIAPGVKITIDKGCVFPANEDKK
ncbi:MAG: preprotein translocase subunit YajC [Muribaculaceae bacterium]|nr:preprotein translocase subunit YajC [Muribaculaceae bacterium]